MTNNFRNKIQALMLAALLIILGVTQLHANAGPMIKGETITYSIKKFGVKVGEANLVNNGYANVGGNEVLWITFTATGFKFYDQEQIYLDPKTYYPVLIKRDLNIFGSDEKINEFYDTQKGEVRIVKTVDGETTQEILTGGARFDNIYGFIYRQRDKGTFDPQVSMAMHLPTADVTLEFIKMKKIKAADQEFNAYYVRSTPSKYTVYFDSGPQRIPLRIDGALGVGNMAMVMSQYQ